jgi:phage shock protein A
MGLFDRIGRVVKANVNSLISSAEDPERILEQTVMEMQHDLIQLRQAVAQAIATQKRIGGRSWLCKRAKRIWRRRR